MKCYLSYSLNDNTRYKASSGGFCKEFLRFSIENRIADKAIITVLGENNESLVSRTIITNDIKIITSTKSNTIYDKTNPLSILSELKSDESYVFVGLPCHILPLKKYCKKRNIKVITISLFCNHTSNNKYYKNVLEDANILEKDVKHFEYRGSGWPGFVSIITNNDEKIKIKHAYCWSSYKKNCFNMLSKCKKCVKFITNDADICVGDAWLNRIKNVDKKGTCIVLSMNPNADRLINICSKKNYIFLERMENSEFNSYYKSMLDYKIARKSRLKTNKNGEK
jgi:coenzyme F420 hydrogenase subunit beta